MTSRSKTWIKKVSKTIISNDIVIERDVFNCLEDDDALAYEDIGMDILDYVNEGQIAVVKDDEPNVEADHPNKDVHVFTDAEL